MPPQINENNPTYYENELDLKELFFIFWNKKSLIFAITFLAALISVTYSLYLPNIYLSKSTLAPTEPQDSLSSQLGNLSTLGGIAGFSLPAVPASKSQEGMERIKSFEFFDTYFLPNIKLENLMAVNYWVPDENIIIYNEKTFDSSKKEWVRKVSYPKKTVPSSQEAFEEYLKIISISENKETSFINITLEHKSPFVAKKWLDIIIYQINESMRKVDADQAERSISYLNDEMNSANIKSIKDVTSKLLEKQMQTLMFTSSSKFYVFNIIDSPIVAENKSKPSRAIICILGTFFGFILSLLIIFFQNFIKSINQ